MNRPRKLPLLIALWAAILFVATTLFDATAQAKPNSKPVVVIGPKTAVASENPAAKPQTWKLSFELAFGENSPYSKTYPSLYELPYNTNRAITRDVLDQIVSIALHETGAKRRQLIYGPGGFQQFPVVPSVQLDVQGSPTTILNTMDVIGFLAQQTEVLASRPLLSGDKPAVQITERGTRTLSSPTRMTQFWRRLRKRSPQLQGFLPVNVGGYPGLRVIDTLAQWSVRDVVNFDTAIESAARQSHIKVQARRFMVQSLSSRNNWQSAPTGGQYLQRLEGRKQTALKQRLLSKYQPQVSRAIRFAFQKYAPSRLSPNHKRFKIQSR